MKKLATDVSNRIFQALPYKNEGSHKKEPGAVTFQIVPPPCDQYMPNPHTESLSWVNALIAKMWTRLRVIVKRDLKGFLCRDIDEKRGRREKSQLHYKAHATRCNQH